MPIPSIALEVATGWWVTAVLLALFAAYVALDLSRGALSSHTPTAVRSQLGTAFALALGLVGSYFTWATPTPAQGAQAYPAWSAFGVLVLSFVLSLLGAWLGAAHHPRPWRAVGAGLVYALAAVATPGLLLQAHQPSTAWHWPALATCFALAAVLAAAGWQLVGQRKRREGATEVSGWQLGGAIALGLATGVGHLAVMRSAQPGAVAAPVAGMLSMDALTVLATIAVPSVLALLLLSSVLEARFKSMLRLAREELQMAAETDPLTQLPNRAMFERQLARSALRADRSNLQMSILFVNLDGFQAVNQSLGQGSGDTLLKEMAKRLRALCGAHDTVARAGGDEFLLLLENTASVAEATHFASRLIKELQIPFQLEERELTLSCSIGAALYPEHGAATKLIAHAAAAMHHAKRNGGAACCVFEPRMVAGAREQIDLLRDLRHAIAHGELELYYQPKIHAPSGQITGAEALMRWHHPNRGMVGPDIFIPLAERFGLIHALGNWLVEDVCRQIRVWLDQGLRMRVAINISAHQLRQPDLVERITGALQRHGVEPQLLTCELTESAAMEDTRVTSRLIEQLSAAGVHLSIDDFGTGYSSLSYLRELAAEELKIDRSFVLDLEGSADARAIVDAVVKLAQALGMKVVAEGVETEAQRQILRSLGCNELQGYLFAKPMAANSLTLWAMNDEGPRTIDFRPSLFADTENAAFI